MEARAQYTKTSPNEDQVRFVSEREYDELIVSRRKLERVVGHPGLLHDLRSNELFALRGIRAPKRQQALAV